VTVEGTPVAVETRVGTLNTSIHTKMINDLPLNGRNVMQLLQLTPGTLETTGTAGYVSSVQGATRPETVGTMISALPPPSRTLLHFSANCPENSD
jgi:hypothetical protein